MRHCRFAGLAGILAIRKVAAGGIQYGDRAKEFRRRARYGVFCDDRQIGVIIANPECRGYRDPPRPAWRIFRLRDQQEVKRVYSGLKNAKLWALANLKDECP